jgi:Molecular chaperone, HSP90 family
MESLKMNEGYTKHQLLVEEGFINAAASKIYTKIDELRGANELEKDIMRRRWIWELIQNASDCANPDVSIYIQTNSNSLFFSHNGSPFTYEHLMNLITQISAKEMLSEDKTGKFGTGFITTHLISEKVNIQGIYADDDTTYVDKKLNFDIDRSGKTYNDIRQNIIETLEYLKSAIFEEIEQEKIDYKGITTTFTYRYSDNSAEIKKAVDMGLQDLKRSIPFVLAFTSSISSICCNGITYTKNNEDNSPDKSMKIITIEETSDSEKNIRHVFVCSKDRVSIAALIKSINKIRTIIPYSENTPKLFCTFPLIGTEDFTFPVVLNSPDFKVSQERNQIQEGADENRAIIETGKELYSKLLHYVSTKKWNDLYNICYINRSTPSTLQKKINEDIESICQVMPIVDARQAGVDIGKVSLFQMDEQKNSSGCSLLIPYHEDNALNDELWGLVDDLKIKPIPTRHSYREWGQISPKNRIRLKDIYERMLKNESMQTLGSYFTTNSNDVYLLWLNKLYALWAKNSGVYFKSEAIVPNQDYNFVELTKVSIDDNIDNDLKEILQGFGINIKTELLLQGIEIPNTISVKAMCNKDIANIIQQHIRERLSNENKNNSKRDPQTQIVFNKITNWFLRNPEIAKELFQDIYDNRHLLSSSEETIRRLELADKVEEKLRMHNTTLEQLDVILANNSKLIESTLIHDDLKDFMLSLGIDNWEDLQKNESMAEVKQLLQYYPNPSPEAAEKVRQLIDRSRDRIYNHLANLERYKVENWYELARTVYHAEKDGRSIKIVIRPSDNDKIILFYPAELEVLDDTDYELWIDNGRDDPRILTLGDILKTTGIRVIPLRNLYQ